MVELGSGKYRYGVVEGWGNLPDGWSFKEAAGVAVDSRDNVYVFNRGEHPMIVFDQDGNFLRSWGEGLFRRPHGVHMGPDDSVYCTDETGHCIRKCTLDGKVLLEIGTPGEPSAFMSGTPFHRCTHTALSPTGEIYVADGYGNARVHKFSPDGKLIMSWGEPGIDPGKFNVVHNICCDADGWIYVADRENHRVQVFDGNGKYETQWNNLFRPNGLFIEPGHHPICYVAESGPNLPLNRKVRGLGERISILTHQGELLAHVGANHPGCGVGEFISPHGITVDSRGDIYIADVALTAWTYLFPEQMTPPPGLRTLHKLRRHR
jgi:DNA-binding beta-propeller fold protein YncE